MALKTTVVRSQRMKTPTATVPAPALSQEIPETQRRHRHRCRQAVEPSRCQRAVTVSQKPASAQALGPAQESWAAKAQRGAQGLHAARHQRAGRLQTVGWVSAKSFSAHTGGVAQLGQREQGSPQPRWWKRPRAGGHRARRGTPFGQGDEAATSVSRAYRECQEQMLDAGFGYTARPSSGSKMYQTKFNP